MNRPGSSSGTLKIRPGIDQEGLEKTRKEWKKTSNQSGINQEGTGIDEEGLGSDQEGLGSNQEGMRKISGRNFTIYSKKLYVF